MFASVSPRKRADWQHGTGERVRAARGLNNFHVRFGERNATQHTSYRYLIVYHANVTDVRQ